MLSHEKTKTKRFSWSTSQFYPDNTRSKSVESDVSLMERPNEPIIRRLYDFCYGCRKRIHQIIMKGQIS